MRNVRIGTVSYLVEDSPHTIEMNLERAIGYIRSAAVNRCDVVCLPESFLTYNVPGRTFDAEPVPGPAFERLAAEARAGNLYVIAPYYVADGDRIFNQATIIGRDGSLAGFYRKVQPTGGEVPVVTPGNDLPVFDLDFGRVAVMICMDIYFPEIPRIYAHKGAEVIFWPTLTLGPTQEGLLAQLRSRAIDNALVIAESNMAGHPPYAPYSGRARPATGRIVDANGDVLAQTGRRHGVAIADIDLDETRLTSLCVLLREPDRFREDMESITRLDLYAREYKLLAGTQRRSPAYFSAILPPQHEEPAR